MPYKNIKDLPESVHDNLPKDAQRIYLEAFNNAWEHYKTAKSRREGTSREETAHKIAWFAVKREYKKDNGKWVKI